MKSRWLLVAYLLGVILISLLHNPAGLALALLVALLCAGQRRGPLLRKTLAAILFFNLSVSLGYVVVALWQGRFMPSYLLLVNLRVTLLVFLGFWVVSRVDVLQAFRFSKDLSFVVALTMGQLAGFSRMLRDFRMAFESRSLCAANPLDRLRLASAQSACLLDKSISNAAESALAMRARGCFDD